MKIERRIRTARVMSNPSTGDISGIAVPYNEASSPLPGAGREFREYMQPDALEVSDDTVLILQHDQTGVPLARVGAGTLRFTEGESGLMFMASLPSNRTDVHEALERGDLDGSVSVGMYVDEDEWTHGKEQSIRKVTKGRLVELSLVVRGAYDGARGVYGGKPNG